MGRRWTTEELDILKKLWSKTEIPFKELCKVFKDRSPETIKAKARAIGLCNPGDRLSPQLDIELLQKFGIVIEG